MITINALSFDGRLRKSWQAEIVRTSPPLLIARGVFDTEIQHPHLDVIRPGTISYEYFWTDRWYNIFRFDDPKHGFRQFYCNLCMPPTLSSDTLSYVDLDIDVIVGADGVAAVLDEDEFVENAEGMQYPAEVHEQTRLALSELHELIERREFPFDHLQTGATKS